MQLELQGGLCEPFLWGPRANSLEVLTVLMFKYTKTAR